MIPLSKSTKVISNKENKGVFEIEALYPGYGTTLGNSLRRVLLSSLGGAAVTEAKIQGVSHEFSTISGVKEDVLGILLNLKQIRFRVFGDAPFTAALHIKGVKTVTAGDFKAPSQIEIINKDISIAHLTDKSAELVIDIQIGKGVGYEAAENRRRGKEEIGTISLDAIYTPIRRVSYRVEQMRVGDRTDFDRLILEVETDGTLNPEAALKEASRILVEQFEIVGGSLKEEEAALQETAKPKARPTSPGQSPGGRAKKAPLVKKASGKKSAVKKAAAKKK